MTPTSWWWLELHFHEQHQDLPFTLSHYPSFVSLFFIFIWKIFFSDLSEIIGQCWWVWMLRWQFNKSALLLPQDRVWADCWPPHSRGGAWAWEEAAMWGAGRKQRGQDYYCDIISLDSFHAHHNLVHLGVQMNLFPSQLSLYTSGPAPVVAVVCCGAVVATAAAAAAAAVARI